MLEIRRECFLGPWTGCLDEEWFSLLPNVRESGKILLVESGIRENVSYGIWNEFLALESGI